METKIMQKIANKVIFQMEVEKLMNTEAGKLLDINPLYLSMIKKPEQYDRCPMKAWRKMHVWYHSGSTLRDYDHTKAVIVEEPEVSGPTPVIKQSVTKAPEATPAAQEAGAEVTEAMRGHAPKVMQGVPKIEVGSITMFKVSQSEVDVAKKPGRKKKGLNPDKTKGSFDKGAPTPEEINRVLAAISIEIDVIVKLKK